MPICNFKRRKKNRQDHPEQYCVLCGAVGRINRIRGEREEKRNH